MSSVRTRFYALLLACAGCGDDSGSGVGADPPVECATAPGDHAGATCASDCPIVTDVVFSCPDPDRQQRGIQVAATATDVALLIETMLLRASGEQGTSEDLPSEFDHPHVELPVFVATDGAGELHVLADTTPYNEFVERVTHARTSADGWIRDDVPLPEPERPIGVEDFEVDAEGSLHAWLRYGLTDDHIVLSRSALGSWGSQPGPITENPSDWTLEPNGAPALLYAVEQGGDVWQLYVRRDGIDLPMGDPLDSGYLMRAVIPAQPPVASEMPLVVGLLATSEGLRVRWLESDADSIGEFLLPSVQTQALTCPHGQFVEPNCDEDGVCTCSDDCFESTTTAYSSHADAAITSDGTLWYAWVETHYDYRVTYSLDACGFECHCFGQIVDDQSTAILHVGRFDFASGVEAELMQMPMPALTRSSAVPFDLHAFDDQLALGLVFGDLSDKQLRLLQLDTTGL